MAKKQKCHPEPNRNDIIILTSLRVWTLDSISLILSSTTSALSASTELPLFRQGISSGRGAGLFWLVRRKWSGQV